VLDKEVALDVDAGASTTLYPNLFMITATPAQGKSVEEVEQAIYAEIEKLQEEPATPDEIERVRNAADASFIRALRSNMGIARIIAYVEYVAGDWRFLFTERAKLKAVTAEQVQEVARKYFSEQNRTVGELRPIAAAEAATPAAVEAEVAQ
jgi:predicted Zn-dependent peptidase